MSQGAFGYSRSIEENISIKAEDSCESNAVTVADSAFEAVNISNTLALTLIQMSYGADLAQILLKDLVWVIEPSQIQAFSHEGYYRLGKRSV